MKKSIIATFIIFLFAGWSFAQMMPEKIFMGHMGSYEGMAGHAGEEHPFLVHMGMPDEPGEISLRVTGFQQRLSGVNTNGYGAHLETGLWDRVGLHIRNDDIQRAGTEIMLQFAAIRSEDKKEGFSFIVENEMPGITGETNTKFKIGFSGAKLFWGNPLNFTYHYGPGDKESEIESSFIAIVNERLSLVFEYSGHSNQEKTSYILEGIKIRMLSFMSMGIGFQSPISTDRAFDSRTLLQATMDI